MNKRHYKALSKCFDRILKLEGGKSQMKRADFHQAMKIFATADALFYLENKKTRTNVAPLVLMGAYSNAIYKQLLPGFIGLTPKKPKKAKRK